VKVGADGEGNKGTRYSGITGPMLGANARWMRSILILTERTAN
jgi:hypothetical protein